MKTHAPTPTRRLRMQHAHAALALALATQPLTAAEAVVEWTPAVDWVTASSAYDARSHTYRRSYPDASAFYGWADACGSAVEDPSRAGYRWTISKRLSSSGYTTVFESGWTSACRYSATLPPGTTDGVELPGLRSSPVFRRAQVTFPDSRLGGTSLADYLRDLEWRAPPELRKPTPLYVGPALPGEGWYQLKVTVRERLDGDSSEAALRFGIGDYLIVSVGDSYASGEGNPDWVGTAKPANACELTKLSAVYQSGVPAIDTIRRSTGVSPLTALADAFLAEPLIDEPQWLEPSSHRSLRSGHAFGTRAFLSEAARANGWTTTFLTFATSGAEMRHLYEEAQTVQQLERFGFAPNTECSTCAQLHEVAAATNGRAIDALLVSIGGNDLGFSEFLREGVRGDLRDASFDVEVRRRLSTLESRYAALRDFIQNPRNGVPARHVVLTGYPTDLFSSAERLADGEHTTTPGCGVFEADLVPAWDGIKLTEATALKRWGEDLRELQQKVANEFGWTYVDVSARFLGHGYCVEDSYYRSAEGSCRTQGDTMGAMHPNYDGHSVYGAAIAAALRDLLIEEMRAPPGASGGHRREEVDEQKVQSRRDN